MVNTSAVSLTCVVPGCYNSTEFSPEKTFFVLSTEEERYQQWLILCRREDLLRDQPHEEKLAVCSDHFIRDHFEDDTLTKLKDDAVPTLFLPLYNSEAHGLLTRGVDEDNEEEEEEVGSFFVLNGSEKESNEDCEDFQKLCRLCANASDDVVYLFSPMGKSLHLPRKINMSLPITVRDTDPLPKQLCTSCVYKVNLCHEFAEMCLVAEKKLSGLMKRNAFQSRCIMSCNTGASEQENFSSITFVESGRAFTEHSCQEAEENEEREVNVIDGKEKILNNCILFSCPLCCEGTVSMKNENSDSDVQTVFLRDKNVPVSCDSSSETMNADREYHVSEETIDSVNDDQTENSVSRSELSENTNEAVANDQTNTDLEIETSEPLNNCEEREIEVVVNSNVRSLFCCQICKQSFETVGSCLLHSKGHFSEEKYPCSLCGKVLDSESGHILHCRQHTISMKRLDYKGKRLKCDFCERRFNNQRTFFSHSCANGENKHFRCDVCRKSYSTQERLLFHQKFHEGAQLNFCDLCGKEFENEGSLYYHTRMVHDGERPFSCNVCSKKFYSKSRLVAHKRVHTGERPFECENCGRRFYDKDTLKGHYVTHMVVKPFQCDLCGVCWGRKTMLNHHIRTQHSEEGSAQRKVPSLIHYYCKICDVTYKNYSEVLVHRTSHWKRVDGNPKPKEQNCEYCGELFPLASALLKHHKIKHPEEKPYICSLCQERSRTLYEARVHRNVHLVSDDEKKADEKEKSSFVCETCGNIFTEKRIFTRHMREHKAARPFLCMVCGKQFIDNQRLTIHMRLHTGEKPYSCNVCGKKFSQTSALYTHALLHTGEKPHVCDLCGKAFRIKADRDNHRRTHTGEKPYKCEFCEKTFRTGQVYYQHRMIHTGERRFPCNICGKAFKRSHTLVVHKRIHTGEKPNICDICGKGFRQRSDMRKHRALHAPVESC